MRNLILVALFALAAPAFALADGRIVISCGSTPFADLVKIQIEETNFAGQYRMVETHFDASSRKYSESFSAAFGRNEIEKSEFPELSAWNGYSRKLVRYGRANYAIESRDECSASTIALTCQDAF